jgi:ATP-dependent Clp protease ATP-binding subunit ClpC
MNESTLTQLKVLVERAVRPVRASMSRKRKMREELLAHVTAVFEEEAARLGNEQAAFERTAQRFGNPAELTGQLQQAVPTSDLFQRFLEKLCIRSDESMIRRAVRFAVVTFFVSAAIFLPVIFVLGRFSEWPFIIAIPITVFFFVLSTEWMQQALGLDGNGAKGRSWRRAILVAAASCFIVPNVIFGMLMCISGDVRSSLTDVLSLLPATVLTPLAFVFPVSFAAEFRSQFRSHREWMSLQIN